MEISQRGTDGALSDLRALPAGVREVARSMGETLGRKVKDRAIDLSVRKYNLERDALAPFVSHTASPDGASVRLRVRAIPVEAFNPLVQMRPVTMRTRTGRVITRELATVAVKRFRSGAARQLPGYFPLRQRQGGGLFAGEKVRKRTSADRGKLTGVRYYSFSRGFLNNELVPDLKAFAASSGQVELRAAYRKMIKGFRVLRGPRGGNL